MRCSATGCGCSTRRWTGRRAPTGPLSSRACCCRLRPPRTRAGPPTSPETPPSSLPCSPWSVLPPHIGLFFTPSFCRQPPLCLHDVSLMTLHIPQRIPTHREADESARQCKQVSISQYVDAFHIKRHSCQRQSLSLSLFPVVPGPDDQGQDPDAATARGRRCARRRRGGWRGRAGNGARPRPGPGGCAGPGGADTRLGAVPARAPRAQGGGQGCKCASRGLILKRHFVPDNGVSSCHHPGHCAPIQSSGLSCPLSWSSPIDSRVL